jgi:hypothetical protein
VLSIIQEKNPRAKPNEGFVEQLRLFEQMGWRLDQDNADYRRFYVRQVGHGAATALLGRRRRCFCHIC